MRYGRHTSKEFKVLAIVMVLIWALTALLGSQFTQFHNFIQDAVSAAFKW